MGISYYLVIRLNLCSPFFSLTNEGVEKTRGQKLGFILQVFIFKPLREAGKPAEYPNPESHDWVCMCVCVYVCDTVKNEAIVKQSFH